MLVKGAFPQDCMMEEMADACLSYSRKEGGTEQPCLTREAMLRWFST